MIAGFTPNWYYGQQNAGLAIYIAPGDINGTHFNGGVFGVPNNATTVFYLNDDGMITTEDGDYPIAQVVSGQIITSSVASSIGAFAFPLLVVNGRRAFYNSDPGIKSITDLRTW